MPVGDYLFTKIPSTTTLFSTDGSSIEINSEYLVSAYKVLATDPSGNPTKLQPNYYYQPVLVDTGIDSLGPKIRLKDKFTFSIGNSISEWKNSVSSNFTFAQSTVAKQPVVKNNAINGKPAVYFDGVDDVLTLLANTLTEGTFTKFFAIKLTGPKGFIFEATDSSYLWSGTGSTSEIVKPANTASGLLATGRNATAGWATDNTTKIICWKYDGTNAGHTLTVNGGKNLLTGTSNEVGGADKLSGVVTLGARSNGTLPSKGYIGEFISFDRVLSESEIDTVLTELSFYWLSSTINTTFPITSDLYLKVDETSMTDATGTSTTISSVLDKSGNNRHATQTVKTSQPTLNSNSINGLKGATFNDDPKKLITPAFLNSTYNKSLTTFTVSKMASQDAISVTYSAVNSEGTYQHWTQRQGSNDNFLAWSEGLSGTDRTKTASMYHKTGPSGATIEMFNYNGSVITLRVGYLEQKTWANGDLNISGAVNFGVREGSGSYSFKGDVNALVLTKNTTQTEQNSVIDYLNNEYQIYADNSKKYFGKLIVVFAGHSIAFGWNTDGALMKNYANKVMQALGSGTFWNVAQPAKATAYLAVQDITLVDPVFAKKTYMDNEATKNMNNILVYYEATNSIGLQNLTGLQTFNDIKAYCLARKAANPELKIVLIPCGPQAPEPRATQAETEIEVTRVAAYQTERLDYNARILAAFQAKEPWFDGYPRTDLDDRINIWNATYYNHENGSDYVHPNSNGHTIMAQIILPVVESLIVV